MNTPGPWFVAGSGPYKVATLTSSTGIYADVQVNDNPMGDAYLLASAPMLKRALLCAKAQVELLGGKPDPADPDADGIQVAVLEEIERALSLSTGGTQAATPEAA